MPAGKSITVKTDENGRAEFSGVAPGTTVKAVADVDGERLESQEFPWPGAGRHPPDAGGDTARAATRRRRRCQPQPGNVVHRRSDARHHRAARRCAAGLLPARHPEHRARAGEPAVRGRSSTCRPARRRDGPAAVAPQAVAHGDRVTITGPFAPGQTAVQVAFRLPVSSGDVDFEQTLPLPVAGARRAR